MGIVLDVKNVARTFSENKGILDISFQLKQREILFYMANMIQEKLYCYRY